MIGKFAMSCLIFFCGLVIYATYAGCDPMTLGKIKKKDEIITYYVMDKLSLIPGLPGLFVAAIIGAALSTLSSFINSCVALLWKDACLKFDTFQKYFTVLCDVDQQNTMYVFITTNINNNN
ncbi:Sodium-coupled monocarboxylate transporter 1, partial [Armadillidium vulgare]